MSILRMVTALTDVEDGEEEKQTQRLAVDALMAYEHASQMITKMTNEKASISKAILKPYLAANPGESLYDGESGLEARLKPHSEPRWLDWKGVAPSLALWAIEQGYLKPDLAKIDKAPDSQGIETLRARIRPGGEGEPRLSVSKRDAE